MRLLILLAVAANLYSCNRIQQHKFEVIACSNTALPEYDGQIVSIIDDETGEVVKDTLVEKIKKTRNIFKPCRQYIYRATYRDKNGDMISDSKVWMMATGKRWEWQPEKQDEVAIQYEFSEEDVADIKQQFVNRKLGGDALFISKETTGILENVKEVWMHPFRSNQFNFTEVAAFPHVKFPLEIGKRWTSNLQIGQGWGDWENTVINSNYKVADRASLDTAFQEFENCWLIESTASASFGDSKHNFWFNEAYGFIKMEYLNYAGQSLVFELIKVIES